MEVGDGRVMEVKIVIMTLSRYCGKYLAMAAALAGDTSDGLRTTALPAAMAPVGGGCKDGRVGLHFDSLYNQSYFFLAFSQ